MNFDKIPIQKYSFLVAYFLGYIKGVKFILIFFCEIAYKQSNDLTIQIFNEKIEKK